MMENNVIHLRTDRDLWSIYFLTYVILISLCISGDPSRESEHNLNAQFQVCFFALVNFTVLILDKHSGNFSVLGM